MCICEVRLDTHLRTGNFPSVWHEALEIDGDCTCDTVAAASGSARTLDTVGGRISARLPES